MTETERKHLHDVIAMDRSAVNVRAGLSGLIAIVILLFAVVLVGDVAMAAVIGAMVLLSMDPPRPGRSWTIDVLSLIVGGAVLTLLAASVGGQAVPAALVVAFAAWATLIFPEWRGTSPISGVILTLWIVLALAQSGSGSSALEYAIWFALGGGLGAAVAWFRQRSESATRTAAVSSEPEDEEPDPKPPASFKTILTGPVGIVALLRAAGLGVAVLLGYALFEEHTTWAAISVVIVVRLPTRSAVFVGVQRSLGTAVGVVIAVVLASLVGGTTLALFALFLGTAFLMMALKEVNYSLFAMLLTALIVFAQRILSADALDAGLERLLATLLGVVISFVVLGLIEASDRRRSRAVAQGSLIDG
jgi:hypothetical protein